MSYVLYDDRFDEHPKTLEAMAADPGAIALHLLCNTWTAKTSTPGVVPLAAVVAKAGGKARGLRWARILVAANLWHAAGHTCDHGCPQPPADGFVVHDFADQNGQVLEKAGRREGLSRVRSEAGRRGATARWANGKVDGKTPADASNGHSKPMAGRWQPHGNRMATDVANGWQPDAPPAPTPGTHVSEYPPGSHAPARGIEPNQGGRMTDLVDQVRAVRPFWNPAAVADAARACAEAGRDYDATLAALLAVADDPQTIGPSRVVADGPWWRPPDQRHPRSTVDERVAAGLALAERLDAAEHGHLRALPGGAA
jgi:hypothetical protein